MGYHKIKIEKGELGEFSKINEEFEELKDAYNQENIVLQICEFCDILGAIEAYLHRYNIGLADLIKMKELTKKAFEDGTRK